MKIQCDCGKFKAKLNNFPKATPGRLVCYCNDCQAYAKKLDREDLLDSYGGTEIIPVYPNDIEIIEGLEFLQLNKLYKKGTHRWSTSCCKLPIVNTKAAFPWAGIPYKAIVNSNPKILESLGPIRSRIMGKYKKSEAPFEISEKLRFKDVLVVLPFIAKGLLFKKYSKSPFFEKDGFTPIREPILLK